MRITAIAVDYPLVYIPCRAATIDVRNVLPVRRPHRNSQSDARILLERELPGFPCFWLQDPEISVASTITEIDNLAIIRRNRRCLYGSGLMRDLDTAPHIVLRRSVHGILPDVELHPIAAGDHIALAVHIRRYVRCFAKRELPRSVVSYAS